MPELIDRNHAEQAIEAYLCSRCERNDNEVCHNCPHIGGDEILKSVPTIEAEPVRHGQWILIGRSRLTNSRDLKCSICGNYFRVYDDITLNAGRGDANFCPNCGARMDKIDTSVDGKGEFK